MANNTSKTTEKIDIDREVRKLLAYKYNYVKRGKEKFELLLYTDSNELLVINSKNEKKMLKLDEINTDLHLKKILMEIDKLF
jgi:hypothetical protein